MGLDIIKFSRVVGDFPLMSSVMNSEARSAYTSLLLNLFISDSEFVVTPFSFFVS